MPELVIARFFTHSTLNPARSEKEGRPIYDDLECVEITHPGDKLARKVFPAHEVWKYRANAAGVREPVTHAMRFPEQYRDFRDGAAQSTSGTPIEELPFLSQGKRFELKALNVYTAEALAGLDGQPLKQLGMGGRQMRNQARAYLENAAANAGTSRLAAENARLQQEIERLKAARPEGEGGSPGGETSFFAEMGEEALKQWIRDAGGPRPRDDASRETLVAAAEEINARLKAKQQKG